MKEETDKMLRWVVYNDADEPIAAFRDEETAWWYARQATEKDYVEDGCYYVEDSLM